MEGPSATTSATNQATSGLTTAASAASQPRKPRPNRPRNNPPRQGDNPEGSENPGRQRRPPRARPDGQATQQGAAGADAGASKAGVGGPARRRNPKPHPPRQQQNADSAGNNPDSQTTTRPGGSGPPRRRGAKFNPGLTESTPAPANQEGSFSKPRRNRYRNDAAGQSEAANIEGDDLASTLARALKTPPYPDCPICFSSIHPAQRTWSCSPSIPVMPSTEGQEGEEQQYCWTTFHTKCIGEWAMKSVKAVEEAWRVRGEAGRKGDWRCPGCQGKREAVPSGYWCFCGSTADPKPPRIATPHSCGNPCSRVRASGCGHSCPLNCHPGPCPPCQVTTRLQCYCPRNKVIAFRCGVDKRRGNLGKRNLSCGEVCTRPLSCGQHFCERLCHEGDCGDCPVKEEVRCYCGKETKEVACGWGEKIDCLDTDKQDSWVGRWKCDHPCERLHDCAVHPCAKPCHLPHPPSPCPLSPEKVTHCPCGLCPIACSPNDPLPVTTPKTFPARQKCTDPIPTCKSPCNKILSGCGHQCVASCHEGSCPPCTVPLIRPCRCTATTKSIKCYELRSLEGGEEKEVEILCDKPCAAFRACGKHQCRRLCCPLAALATAIGGKKGKRRAGAPSGAETPSSGIGEERGGLHECDLVCGKPLSCGLHRCEEKDHRNPCPPCLRSSFEELVCFCGRTVLEPPIPCGTTIQGVCHYPCPRAEPPCGHPKVPHACHEEPQPCPPCPHLTTKLCACGKKEMTNQRCALEREKVSCGEKCGKLLKCGGHVCEGTCHTGDCGDCTKVCGKARKLCFPAHHPCTQPCHAPASCSEDAPCTSLVALACPCGRIQRSVACGRSSSNPSGPSYVQQTPKCNTDCSIAERNARLAAALGVTKESRERVINGEVRYNDDLVKFAKEDSKFLGLVEKAFEDFVGSSRPAQILPTMPPERRKFVHDLATLYRMDTQMLDQEPHRSVRLLRRADTRTPYPTLSSFIATSAPGPSLGKLADLRSGTNSPAWRSSGSMATKVASPSPIPARTGTPHRPAWGAATPTVSASLSARTPASAATTSAPNEGRSRPHTPSVVPSATTLHTPAEGQVQSPVNVPDDWEDEA